MILENRQICTKQNKLFTDTVDFQNICVSSELGSHTLEIIDENLVQCLHSVSEETQTMHRLLLSKFIFCGITNIGFRH